MKKLSVLLLCGLLFACGDNAPAPEQKPAASETPAAQPAATNAPVSAATAATERKPNPAWETVMVGSELNFPPFEFKDEAGQPQGFEIDLLYAVAKAGEFNVTVMDASREDFLVELEKKKVDMFASALTINEERLARADFSQPFLDYSRQFYLLDKPENAHLQKVEDFMGKTLAGDRSFQTSAKVLGPNGTLIKVPSFALALKEVYAGRADAVIADNRTLAYFKQQPEHANIKTRTIPLDDKGKEMYFAVAKGNQALLAKVNKGLEVVKADGTLEALTKKWFGNTAAN